MKIINHYRVLKFLIIFCFSTSFLSTPKSFAQKKSESLPYFDQYVMQLIESKDYLGLRIFLKAYAKKPNKTLRSWRVTRSALERNPQVGFDLLFAWKHVFNLPKSKNEKNLNSSMNLANEEMLKGNFKRAVRILEPVAKEFNIKLKKSKNTNSNDHVNLKVLYPYVLHSLGRAYFGSGSYKDAVQVYEWIPSGYSAIRQVLFEKMWAAYQMGDVPLTLGSIAAPKSAYLSPYLEPEAYLIQTYIYKKLCRNEELSSVLKELRTFHEELKSGAFDLKKWASWDMENYTLFELLEKANANERNGISQQTRLAEMKKIYDNLHRNYTATKSRLLRDIGKVMAFSSMAALSNTTHQLSPITKLPSRAKLLSSGLEIWPFDSGEEWVDEIGTQRFLGESQCETRR